jgi:hypothetical protein
MLMHKHPSGNPTLAARPKLSRCWLCATRQSYAGNVAHSLDQKPYRPRVPIDAISRRIP